MALLRLKVGTWHRIHHYWLGREKGVLLQRWRIGATQSGWLGLEKSLDWVRLKLLLLLLLMVVVVLLMMMMVQVMMVVMLQRHPVVTQPVLGGLGHSLKHTSNPSDASLSLHELLDGWAVLRLVLLLLLLLLGGIWQQAHNIYTITDNRLSSNHSPESSV